MVQEEFGRYVSELKAFWRPLADKPEEYPEAMVCALWRTASGAPVSVEAASFEDLPRLDDAGRERLHRLFEDKRSGVPLAHLTGRQSFLGLEFIAGPATLIPRKETELLGEAALGKLRELADERGEVVVIDIGTGTGNLALAFAHREPRARVYASDISADALELARRNRDRMGLHDHVELRRGDLFEPFADLAGRCDLIVCNPPYISSAKVKHLDPEIALHEPDIAFDGGPYGVSFLLRLLRSAPAFLKPGSWLGFEVGAGQGDSLVDRLKKSRAFSEVDTRADAEGQIRAILVRSA